MQKLLNIWNWIIYFLITFLCGCVIGTIAVSFLQIMKLALYILWVKIPHSIFCVQIAGIKFNFYYLFLGILGGTFIGLISHKYGEYPILLEDVIKSYKKDKTIPYNHLGIVFIASLLPLIFGGSLGLFAGFACIVTMLFCWGRDKYKGSIAYILEHQPENKPTRLVDLIHNPMGTFIGMEIIYGGGVHRISKSEKWVDRLSAAVGGILSFRFVGKLFAQKGFHIVEFDKFNYTSNELFCFIPIVFLGILTGLFFQHTEKLARFLFKPLQSRKVIRAIITGIIISVAGSFIPYAFAYVR